MRPEGRRNTQGIRIDPEAEATHEPRMAVLSALVKHEPGVLSEVSSLFSRRQFNIESLTVGPTQDGDTARMTIVIEEPEPGVQQAKKQLRKLIPVIDVEELESAAMRRELALIKVAGDRPGDVQAVAEMYGGDAVDASKDAVTVEITGSKQKIDAAIEAFEQFDVLEIVRTGAAALERSSKTMDSTTMESDN
ncbi:Acetolactate synthase, small subunit [Halapricum desulfuricans]|uniref:Acetolactate synthase small subunit n=2 Tax=Halapricum desulfuricans TaxID=2841257 RepID=A0A897NJL2_9EURY|nr:Acetolactate synthase, small subunit [Halapricum desulfuricans]